MKKCTSVIIILTILAISISPAYALESDATKETIFLEGEKYVFLTHFDEHGNKCIDITDENDITQKLTYYANEGIIYLDNTVIAVVETVPSEVIDLDIAFPNSDNWTYEGIASNRITWVQGTTVAVVAGAIACVISSLTANAVILAIGLTAISTLAAQATGGTAYATCYSRTVLGEYQLKTCWYFVASSGDRYPSSGTYIRID